MKTQLILIAALVAVAIAASVPAERKQRQFLNENVRRSMGRVMGGVTAAYGDVPWQASVIITKSETICGGAVLIADEWVIMHGYCTSYDQRELAIEVGGITMYIIEEGRIAVAVDSVYPNPSGAYLALVKLAEKVPFNYRIQPVALPAVGDVVQVGERIRASGYAAAPNFYLQFDDYTVTTNEDCVAAWGENEVADYMFCTVGVRNEGHCFGDEGGPAVTGWDTGSPKLVGVITWIYGLECGDGKPSPYYRVEDLVPWITSITGPIF